MAQEIIKPEMVYGDVEYYSEASFILIVEKETLFAKLVHEGISEKFGCLLLTGQGYPSLLTRQLVFQMDSRFNIPIFGIFDCNPHGIQIFLTYRDGSLRSGLDGVKYVIKKIQWIGIFLKDYEDAGIALEKLEALTPRECAILKSLKGCNRLGNLETEISKMLRLQVKADIEKLDERQASFVSKKLIPSKLCEVQKT